MKKMFFFDVFGKQVNITISKKAINVANLNGVVYIIKVTRNGKTPTRKLLIK